MEKRTEKRFRRDILDFRQQRGATTLKQTNLNLSFADQCTLNDHLETGMQYSTSYFSRSDNNFVLAISVKMSKAMCVSNRSKADILRLVHRSIWRQAKCDWIEHWKYNIQSISQQLTLIQRYMLILWLQKQMWKGHGICRLTIPHTLITALLIVCLWNLSSLQ